MQYIFLTKHHKKTRNEIISTFLKIPKRERSWHFFCICLMRKMKKRTEFWKSVSWHLNVRSMQMDIRFFLPFSLYLIHIHTYKHSPSFLFHLISWQHFQTFISHFKTKTFFDEVNKKEEPSFSNGKQKIWN